MGKGSQKRKEMNYIKLKKQIECGEINRVDYEQIVFNEIVKTIKISIWQHRTKIALSIILNIPYYLLDIILYIPITIIKAFKR